MHDLLKYQQNASEEHKETCLNALRTITGCIYKYAMVYNCIHVTFYALLLLINLCYVVQYLVSIIITSF